MGRSTKPWVASVVTTDVRSAVLTVLTQPSPDLEMSLKSLGSNHQDDQDDFGCQAWAIAITGSASLGHFSHSIVLHPAMSYSIEHQSIDGFANQQIAQSVNADKVSICALPVDIVTNVYDFANVPSESNPKPRPSPTPSPPPMPPGKPPRPRPGDQDRLLGDTGYTIWVE